MPMTIAVTRDVPGRFRGFLASCMLELAPGVYTAPRLTKAVRSRIISVMLDWAGEIPSNGFVLLSWPDSTKPGGQAIWSIGTPTRHLYDHEGVFLTRRVPTAQDRRSLTIDSAPGALPNRKPSVNH